ncbi:hypothetical protein HKD37_13G035720 [Glycine soja]
MCISRAHQRPAYKSQVFINKETEAAAEPHRIAPLFRNLKNGQMKGCLTTYLRTPYIAKNLRPIVAGSFDRDYLTVCFKTSSFDRDFNGYRTGLIEVIWVDDPSKLVFWVDDPAWVGDPEEVDDFLIVGSGRASLAPLPKNLLFLGVRVLICPSSSSVDDSMLEVVSNPWRFTVGNWLCDSDLVSPTGIEQVLTKKDLLADSYSDLEASILDEKEFLLLKVISTFPELSCLICSMVGAGRGTDGVALSITHLSGRERIVDPEGFLECSSHPYFD